MHVRSRSSDRKVLAAVVGLISLSGLGIAAHAGPRASETAAAQVSDDASLARAVFVGRMPVWSVAGPRETREGLIAAATLLRLRSAGGVARGAVVPLQPTNTLNVDTTVDDPALTTCDDLVPLDCSLRGAVAKANTLTGGTQINVPGGTYQLIIPGGALEDPLGDNSIGDLDVMASDVFIVGAGPDVTIIQQTQPDDRVLEVNPALDPNFVFVMFGVTINGGRETTGVGGGGMISGAPGNSTIIRNCIFTGNQASGLGTPVGGAILNVEGTLTVDGSTISGNTAEGGGGGISFDGGNSPSSMTVDNSTFTNNTSASSTSGGGGISISGLIDTVAVRRTHFTGNQATSVAGGGGGAIANSSTPVGTLSVFFGRFVGNTAAVSGNGNTLSHTGGGTLAGDDNWWGVNTGPAVGDLNGVTVTRWLQLRHVASPNPISVNASTTLTADILGRNTGGPLAAGDLNGLPAFPVPPATIFSNPVLGTLSAAAMQFTGGAATATFTAGSTGGNGSADATADNQTVTAPITINAPPVVTTQPSDQTVCVGATATFMAAASGFPAPTVQWQVSTDGGVTFTDIPGATSTTLSFTATLSDNGNRYRAVFTNSEGSATSNAATLTVNTPPAVTLNPANVTVNAGQTATFMAAASGSPTPTVQWQVSTDGGATFTDIPGATSTTLSFTATAADNGNKYRAVFTNACGSATTTAATLTVNVAPSVTTQPTNQTVCAGSTATFTAAASGSPTPTVQWQVSTDGGATFTNIPGATSTTLSFTATIADNGNQYRAVFTNAAGTATSNAATLTVNTAPTVTMNPTDQSVNSGQTATFTAAASGSPTPTVQWQVSTDGGATFTDIPGATSTTLSFTATPADNNNKYRAVFTNPCGTATTTAATLKVDRPVAVVSGDATICPGRTTTIRADFTGPGPVDITWSDGFVQNGVAASPALRDVSPAVTTTYTITSISNANGPGTASGSATVTVNPACAAYYTVQPCRVVDTRAGQGPALGANTMRSFQVTGLCNVPSDAKAVAVVVTAVGETDFGDLRLFPAGAAAPVASTVNFAANHVRAGNGLVSVGTGGQVSVQCDMPPGSTGITHFVLDVMGYFK